MPIAHRVISLFTLLAVSCGATTAEEQRSLPEGNYVYLGTGSSQAAPKPFSISSQGQIIWKESSGSPTEAVLRTTVPTRKRTGKRNKQTQWDYYKYPLIKWKSHPLTTIAGASCQLTTTFDPTGGVLHGGLVRYTLTLSNVANLPAAVSVQLLDENGFKLNEFSINKESFHPVPGTGLLEASDEGQCSKNEYRKSRDYLVM